VKQVAGNIISVANGHYSILVLLNIISLIKHWLTHHFAIFGPGNILALEPVQSPDTGIQNENFYVI